MNVIRMKLIRKMFSEKAIRIKISEASENTSEHQSDKKYPDMKSWYEILMGFTPVMLPHSPPALPGAIAVFRARLPAVCGDRASPSDSASIPVSCQRFYT